VIVVSLEGGILSIGLIWEAVKPPGRKRCHAEAKIECEVTRT